MQGYNFDKVIIECSPFLRCMMTAGHVAEALGVKEVMINHRAAEMPLTRYEKNPIPDLKYCKSELDFETMKKDHVECQSPEYFPSGINFVEADEEPAMYYIEEMIYVGPEKVNTLK